MPFPYNFVPVDSNLTIKDKPSNRLCFDLDKNSGEMNLTIKTLTPTICGHFQTEYGDVSTETKAEIDKNLANGQNFNSKKHVIEPLFLNNENENMGPVIIPSTSIKGMIRQAVSSLLSAPMSKVEEKQYSYRPNLSPDRENIGTIIPAFVTSTNDDGSVNVCVSTMKNFIFCHNSIRNSISSILNNKRFAIPNGDFTIDGVEKVSERGCNKLKSKRGEPVHFKGKTAICTYHSGLDGDGVLAAIFSKNPNPRKAYGWGIFEKYRPNVRIPNTIIKHFYATLNHLVKQNEEDKSSLKNVLLDTLNKQARMKLKSGDIVFLEVRAGDSEVKTDGSNIISMGLNFRYRWMYRDSVNKKNGVLRQEIFDLSKEEFDEEFGIPKETNMQRSLFGFVDDESKNSLAGRISPNSAIEVDSEKAAEDRFLKNNNNSFYMVLKPLGSPKTSAVEMYLTQDNIDKRKDQGVVCTYGDTLDDESAGDLRGRKGYLHQSTCRNQSSFLNNPREESYLSDQSSIVGYVSRPETLFRSKIRFQNLENWELGALIMAVSPKPEYVRIILEEMNEELGRNYNEYSNYNGDNYYAQKIGHGRPLGLGSIACNIDELNLLQQDGNRNLDFNNNQENIIRYIRDFAKVLIQKLQNKKQIWVRQVFLSWLKMRRFANTQMASYFTSADNRGNNTIYNYHTAIRRSHCMNRKKAGKPRLSENVLPNL